MTQLLDEKVINQATGEVKQRRTRASSDGKKLLTFVYSDNSGVVKIKEHSTSEFSKKRAWEEFQKELSLSNPILHTTFIGETKTCPDKLREPTRAELLKLAGIED